MKEIHLLDCDGGVMWEVGLGIESEEEIDLLLALELGCDLSCGDGADLDRAAVNLLF